MQTKDSYRHSGEEVLAEMNRAGREHRPFFFALSYELDEGLFIPEPLSLDLRACGIAFRIGKYRSPLLGSPHSPIPSIVALYPESEGTYSQRFDTIQQGLKHGDSFLANLTIRTPISLSTNRLMDIYEHTEALYQLCLEGEFVCYSPEIFVRISDNEISTYPMKGTIRADREGSDRELLEDYKENCEHSTIVDLMRNDLNQIAKQVRVRRFKYLDLLHTTSGKIWQMSSEIVGQLGEDWHCTIGDIIRRLLPAGSISGAPKAKTCELIASAEGQPRGYYTGICGYYDGDSFDSGVMIRFIEHKDVKYFYRSGGGITINSREHEEYLECLQKVYLPIKG